MAATVISLFSGAMGLELGLEKAGLKIVIGQDFDASCIATMRANGHKVLGGNIRMIDYIRPRFFIMENVKGLMSAPLIHISPAQRNKDDPEQQLGTVLYVILSEFHKLGYKTWSIIKIAIDDGKW